MNKTDIQRSMGENLYEARLRAHLTQEELAELAGISPSYCTNLEHGRKAMSSVILRKLADALHVSADSILYGNDLDVHILNILAMLRGQPENTLIFIENSVHFMLTEIDRYEKEHREEAIL